MNKEQLVNLVIIPTLKEIPKGLSAESVLAITMIIAHESLRGNFLKQMGSGPGLGLGNIEPITHDSKSVKSPISSPLRFNSLL